MEREDLRFDSGSERCAAWLFRPSPPARAAPCVVIGSGLSCVRDQGLAAVAERFAAAGIAALAFDYRHFGDSGGEPRSLMSAARQREDWRAALAFARGVEGVDPRRIIPWGFSLGGGHVQALAASEPGIAAAICVAPVIDGARTLFYVGGPGHILRLGMAGLRDGARALRRAEPHMVAATGPPGSLAVLNSPGSAPGFASITEAGSTWRNELCARAVLAPPYRLAAKTRRIGCPILYCITEGDDINSPRLGKAAARRAPRGELRTYPGGHFATFKDETLERSSADQIDFLRRHLGAATGA